MAKTQKKSGSYKVGKSDRDITVAVHVDGQLGAVMIHLDKRLLVSAPAPIGQLTVGKASEVKGKLLIVETKVTDVLRNSNKMNVDVKLAGGPTPKTVPSPGEVAEQGDSILFETSILLRE